MAMPATVSDEPVTPAGRLFLQPEMNTVIHCILRTKDPIDLDAVNSTFSSSLLLQHPRFCSLLVRDREGLEHWHRTHVDFSRHLIVVNDPIETEENYRDDGGGVDSAVNRYVADLAISSPLSFDKPLWELHILMAHRCAVFRIHHSLGDGISLLSMLLASCRRADDPETVPRMFYPAARNKGTEPDGRKVREWLRFFWRLLKTVLFSLVFVADFVARTVLWVRDRKTVISGGHGVELWPRKLGTAVFSIQDMKTVKNAVANATINDVLLAVVSCGLSRYLEHRSPNSLGEGHRLTGMAVVNLREQPSLEELCDMMKHEPRFQSGNKFGVILLPVYYHKAGEEDPLYFLRRAKKMVDMKKHSLEAHFSYKVGSLVLSLIGSKYASLLNYRLICNTSFTISNVAGPPEEITIAGNPITFLGATVSSLPHALTMHMVSYAGRAYMHILVAKDIIPDPEFLAKCFEDALFQMKQAAISSVNL